MLQTHIPVEKKTGPTHALAPTVTYQVGKPRPGMLRLWSIQPLSVWEQLRCRKTLYVDPCCLAEVDSFEDMRWQYDWMREQMAKRLPGYGGHYPWWAYLRPKPDLRRMIWEIEPFGSRHVRLELAIESNRVLLSNLEAWFAGMDSHGYVGIDHADYEAWAAEMKQQGIGFFQWPIPEPWQSHRVASWERIFDLDLLARGGSWTDLVQATFERLDLADVVAVTEFSARGRPRDETR